MTTHILEDGLEIKSCSGGVDPSLSLGFYDGKAAGHPYDVIFYRVSSADLGRIDLQSQYVLSKLTDVHLDYFGP